MDVRAARTFWTHPPRRTRTRKFPRLTPAAVANRSIRDSFIPEEEAWAAVKWLRKNLRVQPRRGTDRSPSAPKKRAPISPPHKPAPRPVVGLPLTRTKDGVTATELARELHVPVYQLQTCARFDGAHLLASSTVPARLVSKYRQEGGAWVIARAAPSTRSHHELEESADHRQHSDDSTVGRRGEDGSAMPHQTPPQSLPQPLLQAGGTLNRAEVVAIRERLRATPPPGHGEAVRTTRARTMYWISQAAQQELAKIPGPSGPPIELVLQAGLLLFTEPVDSRGRRGGGTVRGLSWTFEDHSNMVEIYRWHDTADHGALFPDVATQLDLSAAWPTLPGEDGATLELLARCWELMHRPHEISEDLPTPPGQAATERERSPASMTRQGPRGEVVFRSLVFSSRSRRAEQRELARSMVSGRHLRAYSVRPHLRRRPGELIPSIPVAGHVRGGGLVEARAGRRDGDGPVTVYFVGPRT